jgi:hypothetical protein
VELDFTGRVIQWPGPSPYYFVPVSDEEDADISKVRGYMLLKDAPSSRTAFLRVATVAVETTIRLKTQAGQSARPGRRVTPPRSTFVPMDAFTGFASRIKCSPGL